MGVPDGTEGPAPCAPAPRTAPLERVCPTCRLVHIEGVAGALLTTPGIEVRDRLVGPRVFSRGLFKDDLAVLHVDVVCATTLVPTVQKVCPLYDAVPAPSRPIGVPGRGRAALTHCQLRICAGIGAGFHGRLLTSRLGLSARVVRPAFLGEGAGPLAGVLGPYYEADGLVLQGVALLHRPSEGPEDRLLDLAHGQGPVLGDAPSEVLRRLHQFFGWDHAVHQADTMGLPRAHAVSHEEDLHGLAEGDLPRQTHHGAAAGGEGALDLGG